MNTAIPSRRGGGTATLDVDRLVFYEAIEEIADAQPALVSKLDEIRDLMRELASLQRQTNRLLEPREK